MLKAIVSDITTLKVDAIVNAANNRLMGGYGVDGAIHRAAGPELLEETMKLGGCETGQAKITKGYKLPAKYVIHAVGPVWKDGLHKEPELLAGCYTNSLALAQKHNCKSIALPCISTGVYGYPQQKAAPIAIKACADYIKEHKYACEITFCCFSTTDLAVYNKILEKDIKGNK